MTAHPDRYPQPPDHRPVQTDERAATRDDSPRVAGPVPISVWRLDDRDDDQPATQPGAGFASRLAKRLVLVYTSHGQTVVDLDDDAHLHRAATTTGRSYLAVTEPTRLADLHQLSQPVSLITVRWPRTATPCNADQKPPSTPGAAATWDPEASASATPCATDAPTSSDGSTSTPTNHQTPKEPSWRDHHCP